MFIMRFCLLYYILYNVIERNSKRFNLTNIVNRVLCFIQCYRAAQRHKAKRFNSNIFLI